MCIKTKENKLKVAESDIFCYKYLEIGYRSSNFRTPFQRMYVPSSIISGEKPLKAKGRCKRIKEWDNYRWNEGLIHTFENLEDAVQCTMQFSFFENAIFKCIIPKGTKYVEGTFNRANAYASKEIVFQEVAWTNFLA